MSEHTDHGQVAREYAAAHTAHDSDRDLATALRLYEAIIASDASTRDAANSRTQVQNIANAVVPTQELLDAQLELALVCLADPTPPID